MLSTWIAIGVILVAIIVLFKMKEIRHKFGLVIIGLLLIFLVVSFSQIYKVNKPNLKSFDGISEVIKIYFSWLGGLVKNIGKVTGYAIHQDWGLNLTNSSG
jgi:hypothetical protein